MKYIGKGRSHGGRCICLAKIVCGRDSLSVIQRFRNCDGPGSADASQEDVMNKSTRIKQLLSLTGLPTILPKISMKRFGQSASLTALSFICILGTTPSFALADAPDSFWTEFVPSTDTRLIFVSDSEGNDANSGLNPGSPVKTIAKGYELLRDGFPDWMLLKRGDAWNESVPNWDKSGRSEAEIMVMGAYGDDTARPQIRPIGGATAIRMSGRDEQISNIAIVGLHLEPLFRADGEGGPGVSMLKSSRHILFEDLFISGFKDNLKLQEFDGSIISDIRLNGCVVADSWSTTSHSQGLFAKGVDGLIIENCVFDSNGFNELRGASPTIFNHNMYIQNGTENVVVRRNIIADASSHGIQLRPGGILEDNLFVSNPLSILFGNGTAPTPGGVSGTVERNLIMYGRGISSTRPRAFGIEAGNLSGATISENILYSSVIDYNGHPLILHDANHHDSVLENVLVDNNTIVAWHGSLTVSPPQENQVFENVRVQNNHIYYDFTANNGNNNFNKPIAKSPGLGSSAVLFSANNYHYYGQEHNKPFNNNSTNLSIDTWSTLVEPDGIYTTISSMPTGLGLDMYLLSLGDSAGIDGFIDLARSQSRQTYNPVIDPRLVYQWMAQQVNNID